MAKTNETLNWNLQSESSEMFTQIEYWRIVQSWQQYDKILCNLLFYM